MLNDELFPTLLTARCFQVRMVTKHNNSNNKTNFTMFFMLIFVAHTELYTAKRARAEIVFSQFQLSVHCNFITFFFPP